jgi:microcystin-dependent protein
VAYFDGTQYQCTTCNIPSLVPAGVTADYSGVIVPLGWLLANGSAQSRTTFLALFNAIAFTAVSATTTITSPSVVVPNSALFQIGWSVGGNNVTCNATISAIPDGTHITISANASATGATTLTIGPYPQGDCSTTFNLPNYTGRVTAMADGVTNITATSCTNAGSVGTNCGTQTSTLVAANIPTLTSTNASQAISVVSGASFIQGTPTLDNVGTGASFTGVSAASNSTVSSSGNNSISVTRTNASPTPVVVLQPTSIVTKIIKY